MLWCHSRSTGLEFVIPAGRRRHGRHQGTQNQEKSLPAVNQASAAPSALQEPVTHPKEKTEMSKNKKQSSSKVAKLAATTLTDEKASKIAKSLAGSVLAQVNTGKQTGAKMEDVASKVLRSPKFGDGTKILAGSALSQANKER